MNTYVRRSKTGKLHQVRSRRKKVIHGAIAGGSLLGIGALALTAKGRGYRPNLGSTASNVLPSPPKFSPIPTSQQVIEKSARKNLSEIDNFLKDPKKNSLTFSNFPRLAQFNESGTYRRRTKTGKIAIVRKPQNNMWRNAFLTTAGVSSIATLTGVAKDFGRSRATKQVKNQIMNNIGKNLDSKTAATILSKL